jgi:hypothetical protein
MHHSRIWRPAAALAVAIGLAGAGAGTAVAASAAGVTITIATKSSLPKVSGHTLVAFRSGHEAATVSGSVTGAASGATATLLAEPFGAKKYSAASKAVTLQPGTGGAAPYSFRVRPTLATSYEVRVSAPEATSAARTVYVEGSAAITGKRSCSRPVCRIRLRLWVRVPAATYPTESAKHWYLYSRLRLARSKRPAAPTVLKLNKKATASRPEKLHPWEFVVTVRYKFAIGNHAYRWQVDFCTRDSEQTDGLGLPGRHGCGNKWISIKAPYLG